LFERPQNIHLFPQFNSY